MDEEKDQRKIEQKMLSFSNQNGEQKEDNINMHGWWFDVLITFMLGFSSLSTAWSGFQASYWGGIQATKYNLASAKRLESVRLSNNAAVIRNLDIWLFGQWVEYYATGQMELADFYQKRFRQEFIPAFETWIASEPLKNPNAAPSPFALPEYRLSLDEDAEVLQNEAEQIFIEGRQANSTSDRYVLNTVFLASVLFLSSLQSHLRWRRGRFLIITLALAMLIYGIANLIVYPIAW